MHTYTYTNTNKYAEYADECINQIFPHEIFLTANKRLKLENDQLLLKQIKNDIFNKEIPLIDSRKTYFKFTSDITQSRKNIANKNDTCTEVNKHIRKLLNKTQEYERGEVLICRDYTKVKSGTFHVNFEYSILKVKKDTLKIQNIKTIDTYEVPFNIIRKHFQFSYCSTCHSAQGSSIDESITIFHWIFYFTSREWIWTAVTRAKSLDNVYVYDYSDDELNDICLKCIHY